MIFNINRNSTLPILQMELIQDGRVDHSDFHECIQNADITFCMTDIKTGKKIIGNKPALAIAKKSLINPSDEQYIIGYKFSQRETRLPGVYLGQFFIDFQDGGGTLIVPIQDELFIHILDSSIKK